ncbi:arsenate reductase (thioredoxin) [Caryophanon tenue]|uniref:Arsenate reductase n=1 Tax=Caryophanon tenue TaxID=33978 RepID=A0A1C0YBT9_9BACL|nr:arsenate reductase (thioredoxin) [Caryophanon tenue]OCS84642.1 arsenate reductase (thioredoxin) [Caryophanon tenue]
MTTKTLYFLCTGNSCRSQMADGWARQLLPTNWHVYSAGIEAHGVNPHAIRAMAEVGIDISHHTSDIIDTKLLQEATLVVTLCGDAADKCPVTPSHVRREHWGFFDPAKATGTEEEKWQVFQEVRDAIGARIQRFVDEEL